MKKYSLLIITLMLLAFVARAQESVKERVYVQTDKELYMAGELLWMKLYTTDAGGKLMAFSKVGYVELLSDSIPEIQVKLDIVEGTGAGWMELSPMLPTGHYRLIAYTRNMRNEKEDVWFEKEIAVLNPFVREEQQTGENAKPFAPFVGQPLDGEMIRTDRNEYATRSRGEITLTNLPDDYLSLAVSVTGIDPLSPPKQQVKEWKAKLGTRTAGNIEDKYLPEYECPIIGGRLIDQETGEAVTADKTVSAQLAFPGKDIQLYGGKPGSDGLLTFFARQATGRQEVVTTAYSPYGKKFRVDILSPFVTHKPKALAPLRVDSTWHDYMEERSLAVQVVEAYTADSLSRVKPLPLYFNYPPYKEYVLDEYTRFGRMDEIFIEFITCARIRRTPQGRVFNTLNERLDGFSLGRTLVLLDNIPITNHELMAEYNPLLVRKVSVFLGRYIFGNQMYDGIISFTTYNHNYPGITFGEDTQLFDYEGPQAYRYFYAPTYGEAAPASRLPDFRHTLLWEPAIETRGEKERTIPFYTSDIPGHYRITVEGIGRNGNVVSASRVIEVK